MGKPAVLSCLYCELSKAGHMTDRDAGRLLCLAAPALAGLAHVCLFYGVLPYYLVGASAVVVAIAGTFVVWRSNRRSDLRVSRWFYVLAALGFLGGAFYASVLGPWMLFFPPI